MTRSTSTFLRVLALTGRRFPIYAAAIIVWGSTIAFCFNLVMALVFQDVMNASTLPKVVMPNRDGYDVAYQAPRAKR